MNRSIAAVVVGVSDGGLNALSHLVPGLPRDFPCPVAIVQHRRDDLDEEFLVGHLDKLSRLRVVEAEDKAPLDPGTAYLAPPGYHLYIEASRVFSLSVDPAVNYSRPSIDVLFLSAADAYGPELLGLVLTGANSDGAAGLSAIADRGGLTVVEDPETAHAAAMPRAAIAATKVDYIRPLLELAPLLTKLCEERAP